MQLQTIILQLSFETPLPMPLINQNQLNLFALMLW